MKTYRISNDFHLIISDDVNNIMIKRVFKTVTNDVYEQTTLQSTYIQILTVCKNNLTGKIIIYNKTENNLKNV